MGIDQLNFFDNLIFIRKYRNRFHIWFENNEQDWISIFKMRYDEEFDIQPKTKPKKLIIWEE